MDKGHYVAPWGRSVWIMTVLSLSILTFAGVMVIKILPHQPLPGLMALGLCALPLLWALTSLVKSYDVLPDRISVNRLFGSKTIPISEVVAVSYFPNALKGAIRTFGNGGLFSFTGYFASATIGKFVCYVSDPKETVVVKTAAKTYVLSPQPAQLFVDAIQSKRGDLAQEGKALSPTDRPHNPSGNQGRTQMAKVSGALMWACLVAVIAIGLYGYFLFPGSGQVAIHFDLSGKPNGWAPPVLAFFGIPVISVALLVLSRLFPRLKPGLAETERRFTLIVLVVAQVALAVGQAAIVRFALAATGS